MTPIETIADEVAAAKKQSVNMYIYSEGQVGQPMPEGSVKATKTSEFDTYMQVDVPLADNKQDHDTGYSLDNPTETYKSNLF